MADVSSNPISASDTLTLDGIRDSLIRQENSIVYSLIERARFPLNRQIYLQNNASIPGFSGSLVEFIVRETEAIQAKVSSCLFIYVVCFLSRCSSLLSRLVCVSGGM